MNTNPLIPMAAGIASGLLVHWISLKLGCRVTMGGSLFACATVALSTARVLWRIS